MNLSLRRHLQHGNLKSTDMNETTQPSSQTTSRLQYFSTRLEEHYNNTYNSQHPTLQTINESEQSSSNTTGQQHHSVECNNSMDNSPRTTKVQHQWTSEQHGKEKAKEKERRAITKEKERQHTKERDTTTPTTTTTKEKEKAMVPSVKEIHSKVHQKATPAKASHHLPKEKERTTPQHATNVANKVTLPGTVEFPSTTTTWENKATCQIQHTIGTTTHNSMTHPGTIRI